MTPSPRLSWNLRLTPEDQALVDRAVRASGLTRTDFVLQAPGQFSPSPDNWCTPGLRLSLPLSQAGEKLGDDLLILEIRGLPAAVQHLALPTAPPQGLLQVAGHPTDTPPWMVATFSVLKTTERQLVLDGQLLPGACGSPVLNGSGEVLGLVYQTPSSTSNELYLVAANRAKTILAILP